MSVEWFLKLKEIDSLSKMRNTQIKARKEQEDRLSKLKERRQETDLRTAKLKQDLISTNNDLGELEAKIKNASEQRQRLIDIGGDDKKIQHYAGEVEELENKGLEFLGHIDEIEKDLEDNKTFLTGLDKTIKEIQSEASVEIEKINNEVINIDQRIVLLKDELPQDFRTILERISAKNLAHGPFTRIDQGSCYFCRFKISRIDESEIDMQKGLKTCPQCSRIFLPYGA